MCLLAIKYKFITRPPHTRICHQSECIDSCPSLPCRLSTAFKFSLHRELAPPLRGFSTPPVIPLLDSNAILILFFKRAHKLGSTTQNPTCRALGKALKLHLPLCFGVSFILCPPWKTPSSVRSFGTFAVVFFLPFLLCIFLILYNTLFIIHFRFVFHRGGVSSLLFLLSATCSPQSPHT